MLATRAIDKRAYRGGREFALRSPGLVLGIPMEDIDPVGRVIYPHHHFVTQGRNICSDGDMENSSLFYWVAGNNSTRTKETTDPHSGTRCLRVARNGTNNPFAQQATFVVGRLYKIVGFAKSDANAQPRIGDGNNNRWTGTTSTDWQEFDTGLFVATASNIFMTAVTSTGNEYVEFDDIQVFEFNIPASERSLGTQLLADGDMEAAGVEAWTAISNAVLTKEITNPYQGSRVLRVARVGANPRASQSILTIGKRYRVTGFARSDGNGSPQVLDQTTGLWTGTASTNWQRFEFSFLAASTFLRIGHTASVDGQYTEWDDVRVVEDLTIFPGNRIMDGDMSEVDTRWWTTVNSASLSKVDGALQVKRNGSNNPIARQPVLIAGKTYRIKGEFRGDGVAGVPVATGSLNLGIFGTSSNSWQNFDAVRIATAGNFDLQMQTGTSNDNYAEFRNITVEEVSPYTPPAVNASVSIDRPSGRAQSRKKAILPAQYINIFSQVLSSTFPDREGTLVWVGDHDEWVKSSSDFLVRIAADASSNYIFLSNAGSNFGVPQARFSGNNVANTTVRPINQGIVMPHPINVIAMSYSVDQNFLRLYINGRKAIEATGTMVAWTDGRALSSGECVIGAQNTENQAPMTGIVEGVYLYSVVQDDVWHREFARRHGVAA